MSRMSVDSVECVEAVSRWCRLTLVSSVSSVSRVCRECVENVSRVSSQGSNSNYVVLHTKLPARRCCEPAAATSGAQAADERVRLAALFRNHPVRFNYLGARSLSTTPSVNWRQGPMMRKIERMVHDFST